MDTLNIKKKNQIMKLSNEIAIVAGAGKPGIAFARGDSAY
jgi:hypothetical protein